MLDIIEIISLNKISINRELIIIIQNVINNEMSLAFLFLNQFTVLIEDSKNVN